MEKANILVVDDSFSNLLLIKDILSSNDNYRVFTENDGDRVLEQLNANKIDLILLDIMMPKTDGYEVCRRIKEDAGFRDIPIVFLTAKVDESSLLRGFELGGADYIKKPFLISELMARVKNHILLKKTNERLKNELFKHSITQQQLEASQRELTIRNKIAHQFLTDPSNEAYNILLEEILKYVEMDFGAFGYLDSIDGRIPASSKKLICPALYSGSVESDQNYVYSMDDIGDIALAAIGKKPVVQKNNVSKLFFTSEEVKCMIAMPVIYKNDVIAIIACAGRQNEYIDHCREKLAGIADFVAQIIYNRMAENIARHQLIHSINDTQAHERSRFAKDIHDGLGGLLSSLNTYISILKSGLLSQTETSGMLGEMQKIVTETAQEARNIANNQNSDTVRKLGLSESIRYQFERIFMNSKGTELILIDSSYAKTSDERETAIYRMVNELMNNAYKYSHATRIYITISSAIDKIQLTYHDNGIGFDVDQAMERIKNKPVSGLRNIQERVISLNGKIKIGSAPNKGMLVEIEI